MAAGYLWNLALDDPQNISVFPGFCKRVRFRKSNCQRCLEICPESAISLDPGPTIKNGCTDCGLCQNVCPTEVFQDEPRTGQDLLNQSKEFLGKDPQQPPGEKKRLFIYCQRAENRNKNSLLVTCLGRVTANVILGTALSGFDEVVLTKGICSQCHFHQGEKLLTNSITTSRVLLESAGLREFSISMKEKEKNREDILSRREIFSKISNKVKNKAASFVCHTEKAIREKLTGDLGSKKGIRPSPERELLRKLLKQRRWENAMVVEYKPEFPWGKIRIDEKNCSACGTCLVLCPTGAISRRLGNEKQTLYFNSSLCTNCSLCKEACPKNAIDFEENFALDEILEGQATVVARIRLTSCTICGEAIAGENSKLCPTCEKRQVWSTHVNV